METKRMNEWFWQAADEIKQVMQKKKEDKSRKDKWWWRKQESNNRTVCMSGVAAGVSHMAFLLLCHVAQRDINRGFWCYSSWETNWGESVTKPDKKVTPIASPLYKAEKKFKKWQIEEEDWIKEVTGKNSACQKNYFGNLWKRDNAHLLLGVAANSLLNILLCFVFKPSCLCSCWLYKKVG